MYTIKFMTELHLLLLNDAKYKLLKDFKVKVGLSTITVPAGFITDFASVPRIPIVYMLLANKGSKAAVLHDHIYYHNSYPRDKCDDIFYHALRASDVGYIAAKTMYYGVRIGGAGIYDSYTEQIIHRREKKWLINNQSI